MQTPTYKAELCKFLAAGRSCPFGDKCVFAHGEHELRARPGLKKFLEIPE